jgi:ComF family protein
LQENETYLCATCEESIIYHEIYFRIDSLCILAAATDYDIPAVKELIHLLKYRRIETAAAPMAACMIEYLSQVPLSLDNAVLLPVPLHPKKMRKRGFNQAALIAQAIGAHYDLPVYETCITRTRPTETQAGKTIKERLANLKGCFALEDPLPFDTTRTVILVDDVYTSGTTMREITKLLRKKRVRNIIALVFAKA